MHLRNDSPEDTREERQGCCVETDLKDNLPRGFLPCLQKSFCLRLSSGGCLHCRATLASKDCFQVAAVQSLSHAQLFATPRTSAHQASMSFTISQSLLKLMSTVSVMPSKHLTFCFPLLLLLVLGLGQHKIYVVHKCNMFIFHWFYFPRGIHKYFP